MAHRSLQGGIGKGLPDRRHLGTELGLGIAVILGLITWDTGGPIIDLPCVITAAKIEGEGFHNTPFILGK